MGLFRSSSAQRFLAIDLGSAALKVLVAQGQRAAPPVIRDFRIVHLNSGANPTTDEISTLLSSLTHDLRYSGRTARLAISGRHAIIRVIDMPASSRDDVQRALSFQLARYVPIPPDEASFDFIQLPHIPAREGRHKVLLVAIRRTIVETYNAAARAAGLEVLLIDVEPLAAVNALVALRSSFDRAAGLPHIEHFNGALVHVGARHTDLCILRDGALAACRALEYGDLQLAREIADAKRIELHTAAAMVRPGFEPDADTRPCLEHFVRRIAVELGTSFEFLRREAEFSCDRVYLTGGVADCADMPGLLTHATAIPCVRFDALQSCLLDPLEHRVTDLREHAGMFAPAIGLAVRTLKLP